MQNAKLADLLKTEVKPLTHRYANGESMKRSTQVESELQSVLALPANEWLRRTGIKEKTDPGYVSDECLVYVLRAALGSTEGDILAGSVSEALLSRVEKRFNWYLRETKFPEYYREEAAADMIGDLFMKLCKLDTDADDFAQVRFGMYLKRLCFEARGKYLKYGSRDRKTDFIDAPVGEYEVPYDLEAEKPAGYSAVDWADGQKGLEVLPEPIRTAYILRHGNNWQIESIEEGVPTLSKHFGKTERTIRNWLTEADRRLQEWKETRVL